MSKYTTEVRFICESLAGLVGSQGYNGVNEIINKAIPFIFNFDFPIFDENYRNILCTKILKHYYTREIAEETLGLWKLRLDTRLNEIMPYYNKMYESELLEFNPLYDVDISTEHNSNRSENVNRSGSNSSNTRTSGSSTNWDVYSDTPQGSLENVQNEEYLTNARKVSDESIDSGETNGEYSEGSDLTNIENYINRVKGKNGSKSYSEMLKEFRQSFLNIDMMIIDELSDLFFSLW